MLIGQEEKGFFPGRSLILYRVSEAPPELVVRDANPQYELPPQESLIYLVGYDLGRRETERGGNIHLTLYWRVRKAKPFRVETRLEKADDGYSLSLESHPLGLGNLERFIREMHPPSDSIVVEDYRLSLIHI